MIGDEDEHHHLTTTKATPSKVILRKIHKPSKSHTTIELRRPTPSSSSSQQSHPSQDEKNALEQPQSQDLSTVNEIDTKRSNVPSAVGTQDAEINLEQQQCQNSLIDNEMTSHFDQQLSQNFPIVDSDAEQSEQSEVANDEEYQEDYDYGEDYDDEYEDYDGYERIRNYADEYAGEYAEEDDEEYAGEYAEEDDEENDEEDNEEYAGEYAGQEINPLVVAPPTPKQVLVRVIDSPSNLISFADRDQIPTRFSMPKNVASVRGYIIDDESERLWRAHVEIANQAGVSEHRLVLLLSWECDRLMNEKEEAEKCVGGGEVKDGSGWRKRKRADDVEGAAAKKGDGEKNTVLGVIKKRNVGGWIFGLVHGLMTNKRIQLVAFLQRKAATQ
ncbi:hypothetical protein HDU76_008374 [Blyttiomyces sp. JEL0837]|nr:hypothetical protein HDU76_008374 [Blyttiomyces sp. JEL0837]